MATKKVSEQAVEKIEKPASGAMSVVKGFKIAKSVTRPTLRTKATNEFWFRVMSPIHEVAKTDKAGNPTKTYVGTVIDLTDGVEKNLVFGAVPRSELETNYPGQGYVGKFFAMQKQPPQEGKAYRDWLIAELEQD